MVKIAKDLRGDRDLKCWIPGMQVQIWGTQRFSEKRSQVKFKAHRLLPWKTDSDEALVPSEALLRLANPPIADIPIADIPIVAPKSIAAPKPIVLKVCTKSDCRARGGQELCRILTSEVTKGSWEQPVTIREIGCIGKCKSGPHLLVSPDKVTYSNPKTRDIPLILNRHLQRST